MMLKNLSAKVALDSPIQNCSVPYTDDLYSDISLNYDVKCNNNKLGAAQSNVALAPFRVPMVKLVRSR